MSWQRASNLNCSKQSNKEEDTKDDEHVKAEPQADTTSGYCHKGEVDARRENTCRPNTPLLAPEIM